MLRNTPEGGINAPDERVSADAPRVMIDPEKLYYSGKMGMDNYLAMLGNISSKLRENAEHHLKNSKDYSGLEIAEWFESLSNNIWSGNSLWSLFGLSQSGDKIPIQSEFNNNLCTNNGDGDLNRIESKDVATLFKKGSEADWPNLILTSNHARAWRSEDLSQLMQGIERAASDGWGASLNSEILTQHTERVKTKGKNISVLACHTERDIYMNGAQLIRRRHNLLNDRSIDNPAQRTLENISPAAVRLAKLMLKSMMEPQDAHKVDLDREVSEDSPVSFKTPFVAQDSLYAGSDFTLRVDAARIAQHFKLVGYSRGANTVTDAVRFLYQECATFGDRLKITQKDGSVKAANANDIRTIISNIGILSLAPGEVPLTKAERDIGIRRITIYNEHDLTAGHLINPDAKDYDPWSDKLIRIKGTREDAGHNIVSALGDATKAGYIMDPANAKNDPEYQSAQDEVKAFFASNFGKHAINELCVFHNAERKQNEFYIQFAPGISRSDEEVLEKEMLGTLRSNGFPKARAYSDLTHRRRMQVILGNEGDIETNVQALTNCKKSLEVLSEKENGALFIVRSALTYLDECIQKATPQTDITGASRSVEVVKRQR